MYAIFKINIIVWECICVFYNVHPTYLFYTSQILNFQITRKSVSIGAESQIFHF